MINAKYSTLNLTGVSPWRCSRYGRGLYIQWHGFKSYILTTVFFLLLFTTLSYYSYHVFWVKMTIWLCGFPLPSLFPGAPNGSVLQNMLAGRFGRIGVLGRKGFLGNRQFRLSGGDLVSRIVLLVLFVRNFPPPYCPTEGLNFALRPHPKWPVMSGRTFAGKLPSKSGCRL